MANPQALPSVIELLPSSHATEELVRMADALSDPHRLRILALLAAGRGCCNLPDCCPDDELSEEGICVCELTELLGIIQSKVSYHIGKLKEANLVRESKRGKWTYYSIDRRQVRRLLKEFAALLNARES